MNHSFSKCNCSVFNEKYINLKILGIHRILIQMEELFFNYESIDHLFNFYEQNEFLTNKLTFCAKISIEHPSQLKNSSIITKGSLKYLLNVLKYLNDPNKMVSISIEMLSEKSYNALKPSYKNGAGARKYLFEA